MECTYDENKCPKCGKPMSQQYDWDHLEKCSNPNCDFVYEHCGACDPEYNPPCLSHYWDGDQFIRNR